MLTLGASSKNIDWKTVWQRKLDEDDSWDARQDRKPPDGAFTHKHVSHCSLQPVWTCKASATCC